MKNIRSDTGNYTAEESDFLIELGRLRDFVRIKQNRIPTAIDVFKLTKRFINERNCNG